MRYRQVPKFQRSKSTPLGVLLRTAVAVKYPKVKYTPLNGVYLTLGYFTVENAKLMG